jgi:uncharacterized membrane protein
MADRTQMSIVVDAPPDKVMAVIADLESYPGWVAAASVVRVLETGPDSRARRAMFVLDAGIVRDTYELVYDWASDGRSVRWRLVSADLQKAQDGSYRLDEQPGGATLVTYELTVDLAIPMIGVLKRKAERVITDTALKELKRRVEG